MLKDLNQLWKCCSALQGHAGKFILALCCGVLYGAASGGGIPYFVLKLIPPMFEGRSLDAGALLGICLLPIAVMSVRALSGFMNTYLLSICGQVLMMDIRLKLFGHIQRLHLGYFQANPPGTLISRCMADTQFLRDSVVLLSQDLVKQPVTLLFAVATLIVLSIRERDVAYMLLFLASIPLCIWPIRSIGRKVQKKARMTLEQASALTGNVVENLSAVREIRAFGLEQRELSELDSASKALSREVVKMDKYNAMLGPIIEVVASAGVSIALYYTYQLKVSAEVFVALISALYMCYEPVKKLGRVHTRIIEGVTALERINQVLDTRPEILDPENPLPLLKPEGRIRFEGVSFTYGREPALSGLTLEISPGTTTALVGPSGAGKSTFCALIPRFYDATSGKVLLDGHDIRMLRLSDLRQAVAFVSQSPFLFNDTIAANIRVGRQEASDEEIEQAAREAHAHAFITALPEGYKTKVGDRGDCLSGGQKQRIALARAFLRHSQLLILDEATSALDSESEAEIQAALQELKGKKTILVIAHRFSSIRCVDRVLVFEGGRIVEDGTPEELYSRNGLYRRLYEAQSGRQQQ